MADTQKNRRQLVYWNTLASALGAEELAGSSPKITRQIAAEHDLPALLLDPRPPLGQILRRHPELERELDNLIPTEETPIDEASVRRALIYSKMLVNVFGQQGAGTISAQQYNDWLNDCRVFQRTMSGEGGDEGGTGSRSLYEERSEMPSDPGHDWKGPGSGGAPDVADQDLQYALDEIRAGRGLASRPEIKASLDRTEKNLINRMALREVLKDAKLVEKITPSMAMTEQLLRDKDHLEGPALKHAKMLIKRHVKELGDVLKKEVKSATKGKIDTNTPPKRTFANLDLKRTIWKNLVNYNPADQRLYVDQLYYKRQVIRSSDKTRLIIVVDQSGSMVPAMINCTILASIFAGLPKVEAHLICFDTEVIDLTQWVHDPFEVILRTKLGGGNDGPKAMRVAATKIRDPKNTVMVWISDFYDYRELFGMCKAVKDSGVTFIPVGSVASSGYFSLDPWFRQQFKQIGTPVLSGSLKTLIRELKTALPM